MSKTVDYAALDEKGRHIKTVRITETQTYSVYEKPGSFKNSKILRIEYHFSGPDWRKIIARLGANSVPEGLLGIYQRAMPNFQQRKIIIAGGFRLALFRERHAEIMKDFFSASGEGGKPVELPYKGKDDELAYFADGEKYSDFFYKFHSKDKKNEDCQEVVEEWG